MGAEVIETPNRSGYQTPLLLIIQKHHLWVFLLQRSSWMHPCFLPSKEQPFCLFVCGFLARLAMDGICHSRGQKLSLALPSTHEGGQRGREKHTMRLLQLLTAHLAAWTDRAEMPRLEMPAASNLGDLVNSPDQKTTLTKRAGAGSRILLLAIKIQRKNEPSREHVLALRPCLVNRWMKAKWLALCSCQGGWTISLPHDFLFHQMISFLLATWKTQNQTPV